LIGGLTLISRVLGFMRDVVIAHTFGASVSADAFLVAFKIPNFMRRLFAEGAFSQAFIPVLSEYKTQRDFPTVKNLVDNVAGSLGGILLLVTIIGIIIAPLLVLIFAPGFRLDPAKFDLTVNMLKITFPYLPFIALTAMAGSVLNTYGRFAVPAFTPVFLNIALIATTLWIAPHFQIPIVALAWGVFLAGIIQLLFQLPFLRRLNMLPSPKFNWKDEGVKRIRHLMLPALFGVSVSQINLLVDTIMASFLVTGSVSWLYYSDRLMEFPVGVFGLALATVILPNLSKTVARSDMETYSKTLNWALRWVFLIAVPASVGLMVLAGPMIATLFHNGAFTGHDVKMTSNSLMAYTLGILSFVLIKVLASGFYSRQDTRTPVRIAVIAMFANILLNIAFISYFKHVGLALATSFAGLINAWLLYRGLCQQGFFKLQTGWRIFLLRIFTASVGMAILLWWGSGNLNNWLTMSILERGVLLLMLIIGGMLFYFVSLLILGFRFQHIHLK